MDLQGIISATIESIPDFKIIEEALTRIVPRYQALAVAGGVTASEAFAKSSEYGKLQVAASSLPDGELTDEHLDQFVALGLFRNRPAPVIDPVTGQPKPRFDGHRLKNLVAALPGIVGQLPGIVSNIQAGYAALQPLLAMFGMAAA